jgi:hypothetical protein
VKTIESLQIQDLEAHPIWRYCGSDEEGQILVRPVKSLPVSDLKNKIVGTQVSLANGLKVWAVVGNVDSNNPILTRHFLTLSVFQHGSWFGLARYHDFDYADRGPDALARFLHLDLNEIFPIKYDLRSYSRGKPAALAGNIVSEHDDKLSKSQLMDLVISDLKV